LELRDRKTICRRKIVGKTRQCSAEKIAEGREAAVDLGSPCWRRARSDDDAWLGGG
jgi:hypothetical protein